MQRLVFFASGSGTNFQSVINNIKSGNLDAIICGLITNKSGIGAIDRARKNQIPTTVLTPSSFSNPTSYEEELRSTLEEWAPDLIILAGYLLKIPTSIIQAYSKRIINIHPSLLPKFGGKGYYGSKVHKAVLAANETKSGCSVHLVDEEYDQGPILGQRTVPVHASDTPENLAKRVLKQEHQLLIEVIKNYLPKL